MTESSLFAPLVHHAVITTDHSDTEPDKARHGAAKEGRPEMIMKYREFIVSPCYVLSGPEEVMMLFKGRSWSSVGTRSDSVSICSCKARATVWTRLE